MSIQTLVAILAAALLAGCATPPEPEYRQPWTVYKTRADIVQVEPTGWVARRGR